MEEVITNIISVINDSKTAFIICSVMIVADTVSGYIKAFKTKTYNSTINRDGIAKKMGWFLMLFLGIAVEYIAHTNVLILIVAFNCCITEFMSIIENLYDLGIEFKITDYLKVKG